MTMVRTAVGTLMPDRRRASPGLGEMHPEAEAVQHPEEPERGQERARHRAADRHGGGQEQEYLDRLEGISTPRPTVEMKKIPAHSQVAPWKNRCSPA